MAFLVCYSLFPPDDHTHNKAIYLDQKFYDLIFTHCRSGNEPYAILSEIASLKYKSPTMIVTEDRLDCLTEELLVLHTSGASHPQIEEFRQVCFKAKADQCALTISGDMYTEKN